MPKEKIIPKNQGNSGGRGRAAPSARLNHKQKMLTLNSAAVELLGSPPRVTVEADRKKKKLYLSPALATDNSAFTLSGGGGGSCRIRAAEIRDMFGESTKFSIKKQSGELVLTVK